MKYSLLILVLGSLLTLACASKPKEGTIDREEVRRTFRAGLKDIRTCYETLLKTDPKASGKVVIKLTIDTEGKVTNVETVQEKSTMAEPNFLNCITTNVASWKFPPAPPKTVAEIKYPFYFQASPTNSDPSLSVEESK